ncbi:MAG: CAP domain-containing protein [Lachnospira eligens]
MRRKNAAVLMTAVIIGGLLTSCGSAYNNANGKNSDNTVETQTTVRTVVNGETKTDGNNVKTADKETGDFTQEVTSEENNLTDNDIAGNTEASEQQAFDDLSQAGGYENNSGQESWEDSDSGDDYQNSDGESYGDGDSSDNSEETDIPSASEDVNSDYNLLARAQINTVTYSAYANEVLRLVNIERTNVGVAPLVLDEALCNAANMRAIEMDCTGVFEHKRPNGNSCFEVYDICNVEWQSACGENIAAGQATPEDVMKSWLSSAGHKANILSPEYTKMGLGYSVGLSNGQYRGYWAQEFVG